MFDLIDIYVKHPAHNCRGYVWVYFEGTRMHKTCKEAAEQFAKFAGIPPDIVAFIMLV